MSIGVGENHEINDSDDLPNEFVSESDSKSDKHYDNDDNDSESEFEMEDLNDLVEDGKIIVEELDRIIVEEPTDKNQLTSEEDDCCVTNVSILESEDIEEVEGFNARPEPPKCNSQTENCIQLRLQECTRKRKLSTRILLEMLIFLIV